MNPAVPESIEAALTAMAAGTLSAQTLVARCLERIESMEAALHAWAHVDHETALMSAANADAARARGERGALLGIPVGIKDVIDVQGMPTTAGTDAYRGHRPERDATVVARLRAAGALILGKTVTTPFAGPDPAATRNPRHLAFSPGGSSSGSGAAVGAGQCLAALGTQSGGSVLRPAAYCGIVGFKPSSGETPLDGVIANVTELDHVGALTPTVLDAYRVWQVLRRPAPSKPDNVALAALALHRPLRIWRLRGIVQDVEPALERAVDAWCAAAASAGVEIVERPLPEAFQGIAASRATVGGVVQACYFNDNVDVDESRLPPGVIKALTEGRATDAVSFNLALRHRSALRLAMREAFRDVDAAVAPVAPNRPPSVETGDAGLLSPWTFIGLPAISMPVAEDAGGLPVAVQLMHSHGHDAQLLGVAAWCEQRFPSPPFALDHRLVSP